ncbi:sensor histidine kinase [Blautia sp. An81]|uniref:sensor histidine kinase n=1 Tax=Blautia sp. An81 TaxID=1965659 RepID=UPI000B3681FF|nr:HAMP domain-containing sensor histidine kinase [Blautia sp. An81]OUN28741.1 two-component sensor histidine kinase [Blautia sp. An81]
MDIKSKNYHRLAAIIIALVIFLPSLAMMFIRPHYISRQKEEGQISYSNTDLMDQLVKDTYVLYAEEYQREHGSDVTPFEIFFQRDTSAENSETQEPSSEESSSDAGSSEETANEASTEPAASEGTSEETYEDDISSIADDFQSNLYSQWSEDFSAIRSFIEYEVLDGSGTTLDTNQSLADSQESLYDSLDNIQTNSVLNTDSGYAFVAVIEYGKKGNIESTTFLTHEKDNSSQALNELARSDPGEYLRDYYYYSGTFQPPQDRIYCFAMTKTALEAYSDYDPSILYANSGYDTTADLVVLFMTFVGFVCAAAFLLPFIKVLETGNEKIFSYPFEPVCLIALCVVSVAASVTANPGALDHQSIRSVLISIGLPETVATVIQYLWGLLGWVLIFAVCYWAAACFRHIFTMGLKEYLQKRVLIYRFWPWITKWCRRIYQGLLHIDLRDNASRVLLKLVLINFIILGFISLLWYWGLAALIIYSVILFLLLRKYVRKIQDQYQLLLQATNELAQGNLNGTIPEDLGVFEPFREEIDKIRTGFRKAVDEEVKSTKMKTDLITNVSHDLKTPLTAIITYVDLLKDPNLPAEDQKKYIQILDQKANRLKLLIEDLFEISKATSKTVQLNIVDVDIVSLLRQVKLELQDKIEATDLLFRWQLPEEKVVLPLDSQRTYRVFENLLVNITKYAMPHTRVYITMEDTENHVKISMKNISATELNFNPSEITERFVRGDASRNTEGSGLGLAIAKSFTELQGGRLEVFTDADLFTVEITFLKP